MKLYYNFIIGKKRFLMLNKIFLYIGLRRYFNGCRIGELYTDFCYLERNILPENAQVNCRFVFHYLVSMNKFIEFMNVLFESRKIMLLTIVIKHIDLDIRLSHG